MTAVRMALDSIMEKKGRSFLTMLGIIIGVCAVLVLVAMVSGYNADLMSYYEKLGVNKVEVTITYYDSTRSPDLFSNLYEYGNEDLSDYVTGVSPDSASEMTVKYRNENFTTTVEFGSDQYSVCSNYTLESGRDLSKVDQENRGKVCVIGSYVAQTLFGYADPVGQTIYLDGTPFTVVGTYYQKDGGTESSMDDKVVVPYTLCREMLAQSQITSYIFKVNTSNNMDTVMTAVEQYLTETVSTSIGTFEVENGNSAMSASEDETASLSAVLGGIAAIALLVGGIGIMNIMLVTVTERTREIGIKKAIGAPRSEIITQFLVESGILSALGGVIGILLGFALSLILGKAFYGLILTPGALITVGAFLFSIAIGIGFGLYPAVKASGLQPVDALRAD